MCFLLLTAVFVVKLNKSDQPKFRNVLVDIPLFHWSAKELQVKLLQEKVQITKQI